MPIHKAGKDPKMMWSHQPIAPTSHIVKLAERLVSAGLTRLAEREVLVPAEQAGFRHCRSVEESLA